MRRFILLAALAASLAASAAHSQQLTGGRNSAGRTQAFLVADDGAQVNAAFSFTNITTNTNTVVKASPGVFGGITINTAGTTSNVIVYNNTTCTGAKIGTFSSLTQGVLSAPVNASVGICTTTAGGAAADITILWR